MLAESLTTRASLLLRIRDAEDAEAWAQFTQIYGPLIYRFARKNGLQDADAADLVQEVLRAVSKAIGTFDYDPQLGKFRSWLFTVARYSMNRMRSLQRRQPAGVGDTATMARLENQSANHDEQEREWDEEYEQRLFEWAAQQVRQRVQEATWQAFWLTAVEGRSPREVAHKLAISVGSVYVAKNRVLSRLKSKISEIDDQ